MESAGTRCPGCRLPPRWCICAAEGAVATPFAVDVLVDHVEACKPSSTGALVGRVVSGARVHVHRRSEAIDRDLFTSDGRELWILHPRGETTVWETPPESVRVLLLDAAWRESAAMARRVESWGRPVRLAMQGESRFWLRTQTGEGRFSTIETLIAVLDGFGLVEAREALRRHFELHVFASLLARGRAADAARFLANSPVRDAWPELVARLVGKRDRTSDVDGHREGS
ncbi:hypothetical protein ASA1KI_22020 [Opitutales bacterium ASA1]|uniref:DTW domain-containing protein n=1 Tax=Congregicoccus parvus TaxID=3081749 RepID=UPI002B2C3BFF|nr:hypothetical protein ASA1KI_22020 [Opitutales bacterium ASA1]